MGTSQTLPAALPRCVGVATTDVKLKLMISAGKELLEVGFDGLVMTEVGEVGQPPCFSSFLLSH